LAGLALLVGCNTSSQVKSDKDTTVDQASKNDYKGQRQLLDYLRKTPGVEVRGGGANLLVLVRGAKSMTGNNNPLYIVDGVNMGYDYYAAASAANPFMIEKVEVLPPPRSAKYGSQGQNGVIVVTTKNAN
jgi:outer membrane receptor protein involved in Fe transport